jgi:Domain of unknown function (DUF4260)
MKTIPQTPLMSVLLKLEEFALFATSIAVFSTLPFTWWLFPALILTPDVAMIGYLVNTRFGTLTYNIAHHRATGLAVYALGVWFGSPLLLLAGVILFGHSAMDRLAGYGLKYASGFRDTHLGALPVPGNNNYQSSSMQ